MSSVVILGAGPLGGAIAHTLARRDLVRVVRLVDPSTDVAAGTALDVTQAGPVEGFDTRVTAAGPDAVVGAGAVVLAGPAAVPDLEWSVADGLDRLREVASLAPRVPIVCAGATHGPLVTEAVRALGIAPRRIVGSAPGAAVGALRALVALEARASPGQVAVTLHGVPPAHPVVAWSTATVAGAPLESVLPPPRLSRLRRRATDLWPPGPYALASAAAAVVVAMLTGSDRVCTCFVAAWTGPLARAPATSVGVRLRADGIAEALDPPLSPREQVELENATQDRGQGLQAR